MLEFRSSEELEPGLAVSNEKLGTGERRAKGENAAMENENVLNKILKQIEKQTERQVKIEKTVSLLDNSVKQIIQDLGNLDNQTQQQHQQLGDSIKQIQSQTSELQKKTTNVERSIGSIITTFDKKNKKGQKNKKNKKGKKK
jgi:septal ring factor EnvC (AmiA/AmiB activator)